AAEDGSLMTQLSHSFDGLVPYPLSQIGFELPDRRKSKHVLVLLAAKRVWKRNGAADEKTRTKRGASCRWSSCGGPPDRVSFSNTGIGWKHPFFVALSALMTKIAQFE
ncbi:MAG: hypothetical protein AABZ47_16045, partial [Planctomycetota bacterium]